MNEANDLSSSPNDHKDVVIDTRQFPRYATSILARVEGDERMRYSRGNVSVGGFCFASPQEVSPGSRVELLFRLPGAGIWLQGRGVTLGCVPGDEGVGIRGRFTEVDVGDTGLLGRWAEVWFHPGDSTGAGDDPDETTVYSTTISPN